VSWDVDLCCTCCEGPRRFIDGRECSHNVTYNHSATYCRIGLGPLQGLAGKTGAETLPALRAAVAALGDGGFHEMGDHGWAPTDGNAKAALLPLIEFAEAFPDGVWRVY
jgi:hypothetical protein